MILDMQNQKKFQRILIILCLLILIGIYAFMRILIADEKRKRTQDTLNKGNYLVSLISLQPLSSLNGEQRDFFLKTLTEYISSDGLVYCIIHDREGNAILSFAPRELASEIPGDIRIKSIYAMGLTNQEFKVSEREQTIYEFAKPIFEKGQKAGTVRLGFTIPPTSYFSLDRLSLLAMIAFFAFATGTIIYYGAGFALKPLRDFSQNVGGTRSLQDNAPKNPEKDSGVIHMIQDLERSFLHIREELSTTAADNMKIAARLGVVIFEKNQIEKIIDSIDLGIIITDIHENIMNINAFVLTLLNKNRKDVMNRPLAEILMNEEIKEFLSSQELENSPHVLRQTETSFPDLAPGKTFLISLTHLKDDGGAVISNMISMKDITNQKSMEEASQGFIAQVAHEFLTPLTTIGSYNEMLMDGEIQDREMQKEFYNTISEETTRLSRLIQNLLSIAKIEMGGITLNKGIVKTDWLIGDSMAAVEGSALKKNIRIVKNMPDNFPSFVGDKELLKIAVINVLGNAVKYCPENASITITLLEQNDMIVFSIKDTGYGISQEDLPHIFEKFYRSKDSNITKQTGSGLGLPMTAEIVHLHGGEVEVQSEPGEGTQFTIIMPKEEYYLGKQ